MFTVSICRDSVMADSNKIVFSHFCFFGCKNIELISTVMSGFYIAQYLTLTSVKINLTFIALQDLILVSKMYCRMA
jgi:hypothetical protein